MKCIVCLTDNNLNTHMKVEIDNEVYEVHLCDEHAETTTMSHVTKKVTEIKDKLRNAIQLAIDLGISIPEISIKSADKMPDLNILPADSQIDNSKEQPPTKPVTTERPDKNKIKRSAVPVKLSDNEEINCDTEIEMQQIEVRGGKIDVPKRTKGEAGSTDIKILNTDDSIIQKRFKELKEMGESGQLQAGYSSDCLACRGTGIHPILKNDCPKCKGTGMRMS